MSNRSHLNATKTTYQILRSTPDQTLNLQFNDTEITKSEQTKYLGLTIDSSFQWKTHISKLKTYLAKLAGIFKLTSTFLPPGFKRTIFLSLFQSRISYLIPIWGTATKGDIKSVQRIQNKALKNLFGLPVRTPTMALHKFLNILTVEALYEFETTKLVYKIYQDPTVSNTQLIPRNSISDRNLRNSDNITLRHSKTVKFGINSVFNSALRLFNSLPHELKSINNSTEFKKNIRKFIQLKYSI